jgi:single-strand DNA-binding protein
MLRVSLLGNMGGDPEVRYSQTGTQIVSFSVAVNQVRKGPDGERQENTEWFRIKVANRQIEYVQRLGKGTRVLVIGRLDIGHFQGRDGAMRTSFDVWAEEIQAMSSRGAPTEPDGLMDSDADAPEPAVAGVSSLSAAAAGVRSTSNGKGARATARPDSASADEAPSDLEDLPF